MPTLKRCFLLLIVLFFSLTLWPNPAQAMVKLSDQFVAGEACEALQSIRRGTNPGNVKLIPQATYPVIGKNRDEASHYLLRIDGVEPSTRWVAVQCGKLLGSSAPETKEYLLALSWQPSFCETRPLKSECKSQTQQRFDATNLVLHGLWPQPRNNIYCNVSNNIERLDRDKRWSELPQIDLSEETRNALAIKMPGVASDLHLHEWYKHGTCYSDSPEEYFQESIELLDQVNNSVVRDLFASNIGGFLSSSEIRDQFDEAFSDGAGDKVMVKCRRDIDEDRENMVTELWVNLSGEIQLDTPIENLLQTARTASAGCNLGEVDPAGFN